MPEKGTKNGRKAGKAAKMTYSFLSIEKAIVGAFRGSRVFIRGTYPLGWMDRLEALRSTSAFTLGSTHTVSLEIRKLAVLAFCDRTVLVVIVCARRGMSTRAGWREAMRARDNARLSCLTSLCVSLVFLGFPCFYHSSRQH